MGLTAKEKIVFRKKKISRGTSSFALNRKTSKEHGYFKTPRKEK